MKNNNFRISPNSERMVSELLNSIADIQPQPYMASIIFDELSKLQKGQPLDEFYRFLSLIDLDEEVLVKIAHVAALRVGESSLNNEKLEDIAQDVGQMITERQKSLKDLDHKKKENLFGAILEGYLCKDLARKSEQELIIFFQNAIENKDGTALMAALSRNIPGNVEKLLNANTGLATQIIETLEHELKHDKHLSATKRLIDELINIIIALFVKDSQTQQVQATTETVLPRAEEPQAQAEPKQARAEQHEQQHHKKENHSGKPSMQESDQPKSTPDSEKEGGVAKLRALFEQHDNKAKV